MSETMQIDKKNIEAAIVEQAVRQLVSDDDIYKRVTSGIEARMDKLFAERVSPEIEQRISAAVKDGFDHQYVKRDSFGRAVGEPTTIGAEVEKMVAGYWTQRVDRQGKPTSDNYNTLTRAEFTMTQICAEDFSKEMKAVAVSVTGALKDGFRAKLHETVNTMLSDLFHVRSLDDQGKNRNDSSIIRPPAQ